MAKDTYFGRRLKMCFQQTGVSGVPGCPAKFLLTKLLSRCGVFLVIAMCQDFESFELVSFITLSIISDHMRMI